jgi:two-component system cell cycle response regulator
MRFRRFLIHPEREERSVLPEKWKLERGCGYILKEEKPETAFHIFRDLVTHGAHGLCITRLQPKRIRERYELKKTPIVWLSKYQSREPSARNPSDVVIVVEDFLRKVDGIILLEGLPYLISEYGFPSVLRLIYDLMEIVIMKNSRFLLTVDPRTLDERELALLEEELESL